LRQLGISFMAVFHVWPTNQSTIAGVTLCCKKIGDPCIKA